MDIESGSQDVSVMLTGLNVQNLALSRGERRLFNGLTFALNPGEAGALTGANGAGKTSLLRAVAGLIRPDAGTIDFGMDATEARRGRLHLMGHLEGLKGGRAARDELDFQAGYLGADGTGIERAVERLGLSPLLDLETRKLSAGQRRRLAMGRLVAAPRTLWLLDEPLAPLDAAWRTRVGEIMAEHLAGGGIILAAVHDPLPVTARPVELGAAS